MLRCSPYKLPVRLYQKSPEKDFSHILGDPRFLRLFGFRILAHFLIQGINHYTVCICEFTIEFLIDALDNLVQWTGTIFLTTSPFWLSRFPRSRLTFKFDCTFVCLFQTIIFQLDSIIKIKWLYGIGGKQLGQVRAENVLFVQFFMGTKKKFTPEELKHLQANPYTLRVTADSISYTLAFKEAFWALSLQGYTGTAAFRKLGYNTEVLGFERIHNTTKRIRREARSPEGFHEGARGGVRISGGGNNQTEGASAPSDEAARRMKREILCLQQQMAFLKKVMRLHGKPGE